ncbi:uncharacterized protein LOC144711891 [Wolffia australiana]
MMQELLGGVQVEAQKAAIAAAPSSSSEQQNLKCPRCNSTNTKFCYYNNYNLTQPRHFCKTCRRYWTKGGALRNVPIGGGCRKTKNNGGVAICGRSTKAKIFSSSAGSLFKSSLEGQSVGLHALDQGHTTGQILWPSTPNSHILSLLRPGMCNPNSARIKEEGAFSLSHLVPDASLLRKALNARNLGFDYLSQAHLGLSAPWNYNQNQDGGVLMGENSAMGIQDLYQRIRSNGLEKSSGELGSTSIVSSFTPQAAASSSPAASGVLEATAMVGGESSCWNSSFSWADLPTAHGSFP